MFRCALTCDYSLETLEFLRSNFDIDNPDPAATFRVVEKFCERMHTLFVRGYIVGDCRQADAGTSRKADEKHDLGADAQTVSQLVFEQVDFPEPTLDKILACLCISGPPFPVLIACFCFRLVCLYLSLRIYYGNRVHYLCTKAGVDEIKSTMCEMRAVVEAMLDRVKVDLLHDEIAAALKAFDLELWKDRQMQKDLFEAAKTLIKALGLHEGAAVDLVKVSKRLRGLLDTCQKQKLNVTNRQAWSWPLHPSWRARFLAPPFAFKNEGDFLNIVAFYLCLKTNTTTLERNLGLLCRQLAAHTGTPSEAGETLRDILQVAIDGPNREADLFEAVNENGICKLLPTDFGRDCGRLWVETYGRRFQYKYKAPGRQKQERKPILGTFAAVSRARKQATEKLMRSSRSTTSLPSFVEGLDMGTLCQSHLSEGAKKAVAGTRWGKPIMRPEEPSSSSSTKRKKHPAELFVEHTQRKKQSTSELKQFFLNW